MNLFRNAVLIGASISLGVPTALLGQAPPPHEEIPGVSPIPRTDNGLDTREEAQRRMDGVMAEIFKTGKVAGAAVAVVKDGSPFFDRGYGCADAVKGEGVDPKSTLFRIGSVSKLVTWTALMQLVEDAQRVPKGLDTDVNDLLSGSFQVEHRYPQPVTLWNLLTHSGGFEENQLGYMVKHAPDPTPLGEVLAAHAPARVRPPSRSRSAAHEASYSGWATALAGHIVARQNGRTFDEYVEERIFAPLGMSSSTFREPLPTDWQPRMAAGHVHTGAEPSWYSGTDQFIATGGVPPARPAIGCMATKQFVTLPFEFLHTQAPDGSLTTTATDMAEFMVAHLNKGGVPPRQILLPATARTMHARTIAARPELNGVALGFWEYYLNGRRLLVHEGATITFRSLLVLLPDEKAGFFVAFNSPLPMALDDVVKAIVHAYFPADIPPMSPAPDFGERAHRYAGSYFLNPHSYTKIDRALLLVHSEDAEITVAPTEHGTLRITNLLWTEVAEWEEVPGRPGLFRRTGPQGDDQELIAFVDDGSGRITHIVRTMAFAAAYKLSFFEKPAFHKCLLLVAVVVFLMAAGRAVLIWLPLREKRTSRFAWALAALLSLINLAALWKIWETLANPFPLLYEFPDELQAALNALKWFSLPVSVAVILIAVVAWMKKWWDANERMRFTGFALVATAFLLCMNYWKLVGCHFA